MEKTILKNQALIMLALMEIVKDAALKKEMLDAVRFTEIVIKNTV